MVRASLLQVVHQLMTSEAAAMHPTEGCNESCWRQQCTCILQAITRLCENITDNQKSQKNEKRV